MIPNELSLCRAILERDPIRYLDLTEPLRRGEGRVLAASSAGALVALECCQLGFSLVASDLDTAKKLIAYLPPEAELIFVHEAFSLSLLAEKYKLALSPAFYQAAYCKQEPLPLPETTVEVKPLELSHLPILLANYEYGDENYLRLLLSRYSLWGAFEGDTLLAFIGLHSEGTIGLLEVLPPYRRRGLARFLESYLINQELSLGHIPFCQVFEGNVPSLALQRSLGMTFSYGKVWFASRD